MTIKEEVSALTSLLPEIETRLKANIHDMEAIGMLDEVVSQLETLAKEDQGINNFLDGLYQLQCYVVARNQ